MSPVTRSYLAYAWFWIWLLAVSVIAVGAYSVTAGFLRDALLGLAPSTLTNAPDLREWVWTATNYILGALVWWRAVKVVVLHGSPIPFGIKLSDGRENNGKSGRLVSRAFIGDLDVYRGDYHGRFLYGGIFRSHPSSDKIMRSRLELLVLALPIGASLIVQESRLFLSMSDHERRARLFRRVFDKYGRKSESMSSDRFRNEVVRHLRAVGTYFEAERTSKRIDGLNWHFLMGAEGLVADDFGYQIRFEYDEDGGGFRVKGLGPKGDQEKVVQSVDQLRRVATAELNPIAPNEGDHYRSEPLAVSYVIHSNHIDEVFRESKRVPEGVAFAETREADVVLWLRISEAQADGVLVWHRGRELPQLLYFTP